VGASENLPAFFVARGARHCWPIAAIDTSRDGDLGQCDKQENSNDAEIN
jgi:hypothetical protein